MAINPPVTAPPKISTARKTAPVTASQAKRQEDSAEVQKLREDGLKDVFTMGAGIAMMFGQWADAGTLQKFGPKVSHEAVEFSKSYPVIVPILDWLAKATPAASLLGTMLPMVMQILTNHGRFEADRMATVGVVPPAMLEQEMRAEVMRMHTEALKEQQAAQQALYDAQMEFQAMQRSEPVPV